MLFQQARVSSVLGAQPVHTVRLQSTRPSLPCCFALSACKVSARCRADKGPSKPGGVSDDGRCRPVARLIGRGLAAAQLC